MRSVKVLRVDSQKVSNGEKKNVESRQVCKKMNGRAYMASLKQKVVISADHQKEQNMQTKPSRCNDSNWSGKIDGGNDNINKREEFKIEDVGRASETTLRSSSTGTKFVTEALNHNVAEFSFARQKHISGEEASGHEAGNGEGICNNDISFYASPDTVVKTSNEPKLADNEPQIAVGITMTSPPNDSRGDRIDLESDRETTSVKRKRESAGTDSDNAAVIGKISDCTSTADLPSSSFCFQSHSVETCSICFKRQRINDDSMNPGFCSCTKLILLSRAFIDVYGVVHEEPEASGSIETFENCKNSEKQKESSADFGTNINLNACFACKLGGKLLCCNARGCRRNFHLSCLDPPLEDVPFGVWHCLACLKRKIEFGVHSVSEGVESVWDSREVDLSDADGLSRQRQYFIKYRDLAHVHNRWVLERELLAEDSSLLSKYDSKSQVLQWKQEWSMPHRLLQKRFLVSPLHSGENGGLPASEKLGCQYEWLVKWHGLDYEHATWELENSSFLISLEGRSLIHNYENRSTKAKIAFSSCRESKIMEKKGTVEVLFEGDDTFQLGDNSPHVNKLCEFWNKGLNAVCIEYKDRIARVVAFILSLQPNIHGPFLIISTHGATCFWANEFLQSAPSVNAVVYEGNKNNRNTIRSFEFSDGGCVMFDVLITPTEILKEDLDILDSIEWEAVIVDECERPLVSSNFEQIKKLTTKIKILLFNHLKDSIDEYLNRLSLLDLTVESGVTVESIRRSNDSIAIPKERFSRHIASLSTSRFVEYWVPAQLSHVQLEQYCSILLAKTTSLRSLSRKDHVGALSNILVSAKKCCNHPYILDPSLQTLLTSGLEAFEFLDVGIKASGKLQLLDVMLMQMKKQDLRALILFKSNSGSGRDSIGDILDDFLRQRFGADSYEYVEGGLLHSKKLAALKKFNDNGLQRFVFLLEFRACLPSIKLSSVDSIIIYDSDWTPMNDLRALKKITIEPQFDHIKVFRLYLSCTMEEKVLMLASQNKIIDTSLQNISLPTSHMLLTWGASHLFDNLEKFHKSNISSLTAATSAKESHFQDVMHDLVSILSQKDGSSGTQDLHIMLKAQQVKGSYHTDHSLLGELKIPQTQESSPHLFWSQLLEGRRPQWRFCSEASHWNRKRSRKLNNELPEKSYLESEKIAKRHKKLSTSDICQTSLKAGLEGENTDREKNDGFEILETMSPFSHTATGSEDNLLHENNAPFLSNETDNIKGIFEDDMAVLDGEKEIGDKQKSLHHLLLPRILTLCQILQFPENVKCAVQKLLVHVINNHHISQYSESILQAFQISLCWTAAYWIKYKISHKKSMALAKEKLNFDCKKEYAYYIYAELRCLKNMFVSNASEKKVAEAPLVPEELSVDNMQNIPETQLAASFNLKTVAVEVNDLFKNQKDKQDVLLPEMCPEFNLAVKDELQRVKVIQKKCRELLSELINKQQEDEDEVKKNNEEMKLRLEKNYRMESAVIRSLHGNNPMGAAKLKILENVYANKTKEQKTQTEIRLKDLEVEHLAARNKVQEEAQMVEESKSRAQVELLNKQSLNETRHEHSQYVSRSNVGEECPVVENLQEFREKVSEALETIHEEAVEGQSSVSIDTCRRTVNHNDDVVELGIVSKGASGAEFEQPDNINSSSNALEIAMTANPCSLDQESRAPVSSCTPDGDNTAEILGPAITNDCVENVLPLQPTISATLNSERNSLSLPDKDVPCKQIGIDNLREVPDRVLISSLPLFEKEIINGASTGRADVEVLQELPESMGFNITLDHVVPINQEQNPSEAILIMPNEEFPLGVSSSIPENLLLVDQPTLGAQIPTDIIITIPDEEILPQTREGAFAHATKDNGRDCQINFIDISASDYDFEINQPDNLSNDNNHIIHSNEMSHANLLTLTRGSPLPSNQDLCTLPFSYPVSLVDPLTLLPSIELSSACFNSDLPMFSGVEHYQSNEERSFSQNNAQLPRCSDPLQSELDRISKEAEECIKINDDKKAQFSSDCEKEIEEVIARIRNKYEARIRNKYEAGIRNKYDAKLREAEGDHILRMKKLDENYYKVRMNKCLADAFMSICVDPTLPEAPAYQLDRTSTLPLQQHRTQQIAQRPPLPIRVPTTSPSVTLPAGSLQPISPAPPSAHPSPMINHSTPPAKPPFISSISYCMANPQVGGTIRFPAPHLQPFRPSTSTPPSLPCHTTSLQGPRSSLPARTRLYPQLGPQLPVPSISSLSPLGLAMDVNRRAGVGLPNLTDVCLNVDLPSTLPAGTANSTDINLRENGGPGIFCLSDDD